jgi:hypothetical protein
VQWLYRTEPARRLRKHVIGTPEPILNADYVPDGGYVAQHGGSAILSFQILRLVTNAALSVLALIYALSSNSPGNIAVLVATVCPQRNVLLYFNLKNHRFTPPSCRLSYSASLYLNQDDSISTPLSRLSVSSPPISIGMFGLSSHSPWCPQTLSFQPYGLS